MAVMLLLLLLFFFFFKTVLEGVPSRGMFLVQVNSVLNSLPFTFTCTQNAPAELRRRYQVNFSRESKP